MQKGHHGRQTGQDFRTRPLIPHGDIAFEETVNDAYYGPPDGAERQEVASVNDSVFDGQSCMGCIAELNTDRM